MDQRQKLISIGIPVFNEEQVLREFHKRLCGALKDQPFDFEFIFIDDGSSDQTAQILHDLHLSDPRVRVINFSRNFGHQIAITAGCDYAQGDALVIIDADLQDPPETIPNLIKRWQEGADVVYAVRDTRTGESWFKLATAKLFYRMICRLTDVYIPMEAGDFRLLSKRAYLALRTMREQHRFVRGMSSWIGYRQAEVHYNREARFAGETKYPIHKMMRFAIDAITSFSILPLRLATYVGFCAAFLSVIGIICFIIFKFTRSDLLPGFASTVILIMFFGGVQLISLGILGEYLGRVYEEVKARPLYNVAQTSGFPSVEKKPTS